MTKFLNYNLRSIYGFLLAPPPPSADEEEEMQSAEDAKSEVKFYILFTYIFVYLFWWNTLYFILWVTYEFLSYPVNFIGSFGFNLTWKKKRKIIDEEPLC